MKRHNSFILLCLLASGINGGAALAGQSMAVPAAELLRSARKVIAQTGPYFRITGKISCLSVSREFPPYGTSGKCEITVAGKKTTLTTSDDLIAAVAKVKRQTGPAFSFSGSFEAVSMSSEMPPYGAKEIATITLP